MFRACVYRRYEASFRLKQARFSLVTYYSPDYARYNDPEGSYGVPDELGPVLRADPKSFLFDYLNKNLIQGPPENIDIYEQEMYREDPAPSFKLEPSKLDLREFRDPRAPVTPREFLDRDKFLLLSPRSPLT